ncbi:low molecular weight protein tyrosine phosphatase family protein [Rhizobium sp. LjRoot254]|uniref:low molecular weight protein tyrosine phosphatase family protein n=1 Tax=Rhizobium sp. LjRoot254 TaxID=3342297 RepID=UPI003ECE1217
MKKQNLLFVCSQNKLRSPTAEQVFSQFPGVEAMSAGTNNDAVTPVDGELVEWANVIFVMEKSHLNKVRRKFKKHLNNKRVICLNIPDDYDFMDPALVKLLEARVPRYL